ncbi:S41 family peptidase [Akkermansiaceae bacterium]|nr:S41 family peptidase [Akkermansiaceae bacterium]
MRPLLLLLSASLSLAASAAEWLRYPAISPDGGIIVFTHGADLYSVSSKGGEATQLTQHVTREFHPVWSRDGKWLAFASDRHGNNDVFVMPSTGGSATRLTFHSNHDIPWAFTADGSALIFSSTRKDAAASLDIPNRRIGELYQVSVKGGEPSQVFTTPAEYLNICEKGTHYLYHDRKGYEDDWRKHHQSSVTRDIWLYDSVKKSHRQLTDFPGEDRNPVWTGKEEFIYLSEMSGSSNVWKGSTKKGSDPQQITTFKKHPVRFLSRSSKGQLAYGYDGGIYLQDSLEAKPKRLKITIRAAEKLNSEMVSFSESITEMVPSPDGKEIAFIARGEVFVTSVDHKTTRRITNTPEQERTVDFHPDGRKLVYASERNGSWNLYTSEIAREEEENFYLSTVLTEKPLLTTDDETFQPLYSPDGKSIAYLQDREQLMILDVETRKSLQLLDGSRSYSYSDGDISYKWSPDSKNLLAMALQKNRWAENVYLISADGKGELIDLTRNGYYDMDPQWAWNGEGIFWISNRHGKKNHGSWGYELDVYAGFLTNRAHRDFQLSEDERDLIDDEAWEKLFEENKPLDPEGTPDRIERLTIHSTYLEGAALSPNGRELYYLAKDRDEHKIWVRHLYKDETKVLGTIGGADDDDAPTSITISKDGKKLFVLSAGRLYEVSTSDGKAKPLQKSGEMNIDRVAERQEMFQHVWRQVREKFHRTDLHGVDWDFYRTEYEKFLPSINNNYDFVEMLSELLGELDASHTGARHYPKYGSADSTASLGIFADPAHQGAGIKILEVIERSPLDVLDEPVPAGTVVTRINGEPLLEGENISRRLNRLAGKRVLLTLTDPAGLTREEVIRPISLGKEGALLYKRWVKMMREKTQQLSDGKIGFVHIQGMNDGSFRDLFSQVFGYHSDKKALIVDTRFNGGGWLTEDLTAFLSGQDFLRFYPREQEKLGGEPLFRWDRPSAVIMGEGNYSDAHIFPYAYTTMGIGKLVGMPVPGTGTAVWWERLIDKEILFGIPQTSTLDIQGRYLENTQLEPDIKVANTPENRAAGKDRQLEAAVKHLLTLPDKKPWPKPPKK